MLAAWGRWVHRYRWGVLVGSVASLALALWLMGHGGRFETVLVSATTESGRALELTKQELPASPPSFDLIFRSPTLRVSDPAFWGEVERAVMLLRDDLRVARIRTAHDAGSLDPRRISRDGRSTLVTVEIERGSEEGTNLATEVYPALRALVRSDRLEVVPAGDVALEHDLTAGAKKDIERAELVVLPLVGLLLVMVFGSVLAAALPLAVGLLAVAAGVAGALLLARAIPVSVYATNIVVMVGLGVAIDYSLFIVSRFREEARRLPIPEALSRTLATAGRAILFSGMTVAIGLLGMGFVGLGHLGSMGFAGTMVVALAVLYALTFLPALLAILGPRIDAWRLPIRALNRRGDGAGFWRSLATRVMAHPWRVLLPATGLLLLLGLPFLHISLGPSGTRALPPTAESRRGEELLRRDFPGRDTDPLVVVVHYPDGSPLNLTRVGQLYDLSRWLARRPNVTRVESIVDLDPRLGREGYQHLLALPGSKLPRPVRIAVRRTVGEAIVTLVAQTPLPASSEEARALVKMIRQSHPPVDGELLVTGEAAIHLDSIEAINAKAPWAIGLIVLVTSLVLLLMLGSLLLPLKAVVMNVLSISASYGALVWLFQDGHLAEWLHFIPGPIETVTPIIMFCILFGLSMDYEVLLLSRVREEYRRTGDNTVAVAAGLERTGRLITGAAAIMALVVFAFGFADMVVIKAIGIGMGIAVVVDATIVRALLVPATRRLLGRWNWWAPAPLARLSRRLDLGEGASSGAPSRRPDDAESDPDLPPFQDMEAQERRDPAQAGGKGGVSDHKRRAEPGSKAA